MNRKNTKDSIYSLSDDEQCDIMIYNKKHIFGLHPHFWPELLKPLELPEWWEL